MPGQNEEASAPYIPFRTFLNLLLKMEDGVPQRLDKSFLTSHAGGLHQPIIAAFRYFGFVDEQGLTQPSLHEVAADGDQRDARLSAVFEGVYDWAIKLGTTATQSQLDEVFKERTGLAGSTLRKAVTFYLHGARHLGVPLSKHYSAPRPAGGGPGPGKPRKRAAPKRPRGSVGGGHTEDAGKVTTPTKLADMEPAMLAWLERVPAKGDPWPGRVSWFKTFRAIADGIYGGGDGK